MKTLSERLKYAMERLDITQAELVKLTGISKGALSSYLSGRYEPKQKAIYELAKSLKVNEAWLMGYDVPMERSPESEILFPTNVYPVDKVKLPHLLHFIYKPLYKGLFYILYPIMCDLCTIFKVHNCNDQTVKNSENQYILIDNIGIY